MWWIYYNFSQIALLGNVVPELIGAILPYQYIYQFVVLGIVPGTSYAIDFGTAMTFIIGIASIVLVVRIFRLIVPKHKIDDISLRAL